MKVLVYGGGAVGLGIASALLVSGVSVDIVARGATAEALRKNGLLRKGIFGEFYSEPKSFGIYESVNTIEKTYDYIITAVKSNDSKKSAIDLKENLKGVGNAKIVLMQNGWGNFEIFGEYFDKNKIYNGRVITGFRRPENHITEVTVHAQDIHIGSLAGESKENIEELAEMINKGGLPCSATDEIEKDLWAKMLFNCSLNPVGAICGVPYGKLAESENSKEILNNIIDEIFEVMKRNGYLTYWENSGEYKKFFYEKLVPSTQKHESSTLQDIKAGKKTEIDALNGQIIKLGEACGTDVTTNRTIVNLIKFIEGKNFK